MPRAVVQLVNIFNSLVYD